MRSRVTLILTVVLAVAATPVSAQDEVSPGASVAPPSAEAAAEGLAPIAADDPAADLWLAVDSTLTRIDGQDGSVVEQRDAERVRLHVLRLAAGPQRDR